jgi:RNA polymerase sigma factor (sigma-70 family)
MVRNPRANATRDERSRQKPAATARVPGTYSRSHAAVSAIVSNPATLHPRLELPLASNVDPSEVHPMFSLDSSESVDSDQTVFTTEQLSRKYNVSTKTVDRWRARGLVGTQIVVGNRRRIGFRESDVEQFVADHADEVQRGSKFSQLTEAERGRIVEEARQFAREGSTSGEAIRRVAANVGRSVDAVRQTLRNHDRDNPQEAVFPFAFSPTTDDMKREIYRRFRLGASRDDLAREYSRPRAGIDRMIAEARLESLMNEPIDYVDNALFHRANAAAVILGPEPTPARTRIAKPPAGLPPYLASLYAVPLLTAEQESYYFRKMNYLKSRARKLRDKLNPETVTDEQLDQLEELLQRAGEVKDVLIRSNLRLVVSIAKKNIRPGHDFFEMVSDGNMSLIRAIEKFDYSRGFKLSTYATWAIRRNFARSIPAEHTHHDRFRTGSDELFKDSHEDNSSEFQQVSTHNQQHSALMTILKKLQDRERDILVARYGLTQGAEPLTLEEVGQRFGVTKERIRQLETRALVKLRSIAEEEKLDIPGI